MKKYLRWLPLLLAAVSLAFASVAVAGSLDKPPSPPGQDPCSHGNTGKPCKPDPQPTNGKDCDKHGNNGGVNEDHCAGVTTPPTTSSNPPSNPPANPPAKPNTPSTPGKPPVNKPPVAKPGKPKPQAPPARPNRPATAKLAHTT